MVIKMPRKEKGGFSIFAYDLFPVLAESATKVNDVIHMAW